MQVKKYEAPTIQEALEHIKRELGPEAIILQTKRNKRGFGLMSRSSVEVTAAVSEKSLQKKQVTEKKLPQPLLERYANLPAGKQAEIQSDLYDYSQRDRVAQAQSVRDQVEIKRPRYADIPDAAPSRKETAGATASRIVTPAPSHRNTDVEREMKELREMIEKLKSHPSRANPAQQSDLASQSAQEALEELVIQGIDRRYALELLRKAEFEQANPSAESIWDQIASEMMKSIRVMPMESAKHIAVIGPTGAGKTTTLAKLASSAAYREGKKVGLIHVRQQPIGDHGLLATYAKLFNLPFRTVGTEAELHAALGDFNTLDLILIDTDGVSTRDIQSVQRAQRLLGEIPGLRIYMTLPVTMRDQELYEIISRFKILDPRGLILTKLDEAVIHGSIYNVAQRSKLPLIYFTTGQKVPEDLELATVERVVSLVMEI